MVKPEIDYRTMKLLVSLIAISLSGVTVCFSEGPLPTISHADCEGGTARDIFVGFLFAIAAITAALNDRQPFLPFFEHPSERMKLG